MFMFNKKKIQIIYAPPKSRLELSPPLYSVFY